LKAFPEFRERLDKSDLENDYLSYGFFALYLTELSPTDPIWGRAWRFFNENAGRDDRLDEILVVEVFEHFAAFEEWTILAKASLQGKALELFRGAEEYFR